jgi:hypothetical protein
MILLGRAAMGLIARIFNGPGMGAVEWNVENPPSNGASHVLNCLSD